MNLKKTRRYITHVDNYSGSLFIEQRGNQFYWGLEDCAYGDSIFEISEELFDLILLEQEPTEVVKEKSIFDEK